MNDKVVNVTSRERNSDDIYDGLIYLHDDSVRETYHDPNREIRSLSLYPDVPEDVIEWAEQVIHHPVARANFLNKIGEQYSVELMVDAETGDFEISAVTFYPSGSVLELKK